jgi:hypothetical protein
MANSKPRKVDSLLQIRISSQDLQALGEFARKHDTTVSDVVRRQIKALLTSYFSALPPAA